VRRGEESYGKGWSRERREVRKLRAGFTIQRGTRRDAGFRLSSDLFVAVFGGVVFACLLGMVRGMVEVAFRGVSIVGSRFMIASLIVFRGCKMVFSRTLVVFRSFAMVLRGFFGHLNISLTRNIGTPGLSGTLEPRLRQFCDGFIDAPSKPCCIYMKAS
jgi:hypothetical protein